MSISIQEERFGGEASGYKGHSRAAMGAGRCAACPYRVFTIRNMEAEECILPLPICQFSSVRLGQILPIPNLPLASLFLTSVSSVLTDSLD
jgi:hypothetical protein